MTSLVATAALALAACGGDSGGSGGSDDIVVGAMVAMTGPNSSEGQTNINGQLARFNQVNEEGGIDGHEIVLEIGDDQLDPAKAPGVARQLVESDEVLAILGAGSADSYAVLPYLAQKKVLAIPGGGATSLITESPTSYRQVIPGYDLLAAASVRYAVEELGAERVAIAYTPDAVGEPTRDGAEAMLAQYDLEPVAEVEFSATATNASSQAAKLKAADADFVVLIHTPAVSTVMIKAAEQIGFKPTWLSAFPLAQTAVPEIMGNVLDGRIFFSTHKPMPDSEDAADFKKYCDQIDGCDYTNGTTMTGYLAADAFVEAVTAAVEANDGEVPSPEQVLAATDGLSIDTPVNKGITWTSDQFTGATQAQMMGLKNGVYSSVEDFQPLPDLG
ncbi:ABC transporter substrate-binding protein [Nocardioides currus]|nr:ABC transporter substrate-binding protein [Nocardioides currus]